MCCDLIFKNASSQKSERLCLQRKCIAHKHKTDKHTEQKGQMGSQAKVLWISETAMMVKVYRDTPQI